MACHLDYSLETKRSIWLNTGMQPQYPAPNQSPVGPQNTNPYDFIMNPGKPPKRGLFNRGGTDPFIMKIVLILGGMVVIMIILGAFAVLAGGSKVNTADLVGLAQTQQEVARVSHAGTFASVQQTTKNLAVTTEFTMRTEQNQLLTFLASHGRKKVGDKELALKQDATTDQKLEVARSTSTYDLVYSQITEQQLKSYAATLKTLFDKASDDKEKTMLSTYYTQTQLLLSQIPYTQQSLQQ